MWYVCFVVVVVYSKCVDECDCTHIYDIEHTHTLSPTHPNTHTHQHTIPCYNTPLDQLSNSNQLINMGVWYAPQVLW